MAKLYPRLMRTLRHFMALLCLLFTSLNASAYVVGDYITNDSMTYRVTEATNSYTVQLISFQRGGL